MRYLDFSFEDKVTNKENTKEKIEQVLTQKNYSKLGSGADATVWTKDEKSAIKIIVPDEDIGLSSAEKTFKKFYEFCMEHQDLECLPKFIPIEGKSYTTFKFNGKKYIQISMERLYPVKRDSFAEGMVWYLSDFAKTGKSWEAIKEFLSSPSNWEGPFSSFGNQFALKVSNLRGIREARYYLLYTVMTVLYHTGRINKLDWDLHTENVMQRLDGSLVIIDPWFNANT